MRKRGVFWFTAVCLLLGIGCSGDGDKSVPLEKPTLDGSTFNDSDGAFTDVMTDTDADGVPDVSERHSGDVDTDEDGTLDYLDADDDGDGIPTIDERYLDSDNDGVPNYQDDDDDGDGIATKLELAKAGSATADTDGDGTPDYLDDDRGAVAQDGGTVKDCAQTSASAELRKKPVDIVFVIDNSSSMASEIQAVQASVNANFAKLIGMSGIDYRVIMLADFGHYNGGARSVCVSGELNPGQTCPSSKDDAVYKAAPAISERFFHYDPDGNKHSKDTSVGSLNSLCRALEWFKKPDGFNLAPQGWGQWLRKDAAKVFVEISDDRAQCDVDLDGNGSADFSVDDLLEDPMTPGDVPGEWQAKTFDNALRMLSSEQFGSGAARNYVFHSIIAMPYKLGMSDKPYQPSEPIAAGNCESGENPGRAYEAMSRLSGGLRFPICAADAAGAGNLAGFDTIFQQIAQGVVEGSKVHCDFPLPAAPAGQTLNRDTVEVLFSASGADPISFRKVTDIESCVAQNGSFYFRGDTIQLCQDTCSRVQSDTKAKVDVRFGCALPPRIEPPALPDPPTPE